MTAPTAEAQTALAATSTADLLRKAYMLTHLIHIAAADAEAMKGVGQSGRLADERGRDLRAARDLIDAELLRRCGEHR